MQTKNEIRKEMLFLRSRLNDEYIAQFAIDAKERLVSLKTFQEAETLMLYMDYRKEAPTLPLINAAMVLHKNVVLPYTDENFEIHPYIIPHCENIKDIYSFLVQSPIGIWEPNPELLSAPTKIDLIIVPGVAFDISGNRLGYGKGCYDRFLPKLRHEVPKLALAYEFQIINALPSEETDIRMDGFV